MTGVGGIGAVAAAAVRTAVEACSSLGSLEKYH